MCDMYTMNLMKLWPRLNIKAVFGGIGIPNIKMRRSLDIYNGNPYTGKTPSYRDGTQKFTKSYGLSVLIELTDRCNMIKR